MTSYASLFSRILLSIAIHVLVVLLILPGGDAVHPRLVLKVPAHRPVDALLELEARTPAKLPVKLRGVDGIAQVVARAVRNVGYQALRISLRAAQDTVHGLDDDLYQVDVLPLVETADVVRIGHLPLVDR